MSDIQRLQRQVPKTRAGIVHLGPGAFFRAFGACYTDTVLQERGGDWGIIAVSLKSDRAKRDLGPQDGVFTSISLGPDGPERRVISAITDVMVLPENPSAVLDVMSDPAIKIVTLTVTEKGYCHSPATGDLRRNDPDIQHDLAYPSQPRSVPGLIVEALARRYDAGTAPFTALSCDNLPANGETARRVILEFARARDEKLADWIATQGRFPSSMVDRITPATTQETIDELAGAEGYYDPACVQHEPFTQWVIEDNFVANTRPDWDIAGAQFVRSVHAHEAMKLRCLNGTHSTMAYLGYLAGFETIARTVNDDSFNAFCKRLWRDEIVPTVAQPEGEDLGQYTDALMARYSNSAIQHRTWQIAMDGSQKLPQRILGAIADNLAIGHSPLGLCLAVAAWMRYVGGVDENGEQIDVRDPMAEVLAAQVAAAKSAQEVVDNLLGLDDVFGRELAAEPLFRDTVTKAYQSLIQHGAAASVAFYLES